MGFAAKERPDNPRTTSFVIRTGWGVRPDLCLDRSIPGSGSRHWDHWHPSGGGKSLQAPLDQSLLGLVYRRRPEEPIPALNHLIDRK